MLRAFLLRPSRRRCLWRAGATVWTVPRDAVPGACPGWTQGWRLGWEPGCATTSSPAHRGRRLRHRPPPLRAGGFGHARGWVCLSPPWLISNPRGDFRPCQRPVLVNSPPAGSVSLPASLLPAVRCHRRRPDCDFRSSLVIILMPGLSSFWPPAESQSLLFPQHLPLPHVLIPPLYLVAVCVARSSLNWSL